MLVGIIVLIALGMLGSSVGGNSIDWTDRGDRNI
jgi:hypothetical protein